VEPEWGLRALLTGGDRLRLGRAAGWGLRLYNNYGPTECTVVATWGEVEAGGERPPSIGRPIANTRALVLGRDRELLPVGVAGELWLGGQGLARGYLGRPELSAERFVETVHGRLYRTGDVVRWREDGELEFVGRRDEQVKIRGYRVELGEIEAALVGGVEGVREAAVVAREEGGGRRRLVGYVVGSGELEVERLRESLVERLPEYMVPSAWVVLDELPLTSSGKVDRRALPEPEIEERGGYEAPRDEVEEVLAEVWREVLGVERVGVHDNFFELGGDSISSMRVMARVRDAFELSMSIGVIFASPTVAQLAEQVESSAIDRILATRGSE
jgi:acyl-coenzyme A synthetase/AMP-(fatty) acid ligase/acyl carrier protein